MDIFKKDYIVGLDIGASSVKFAQFVRKEKSLWLVKAGLEEISYTGDEASYKEEIILAIRRLLKGIDINKSKFIAAINCPKTCVRKVITPSMPRDELREGVRLEAGNYFPFSLDNARVEFDVISNIIEKGVKKYHLLVATTQDETAYKFISLLKKAGITPSSFIPPASALQKVIENSRLKKKQVRGMLDIGAEFTELIIFDGTELVFCRKIPVSGNDLTKSMTGVLVSDRGKTELSLEEAEKIKREIGMPSEGDPRIINGKISTTQIRSMLRTPLEQLVNEIERCFDYYREESGGGKIDSLLLFGGGAALQGIPKFLFEGLGIEVLLADPLDGLKIDPIFSKGIGGSEEDRISYRLGLAIGAALSMGGGINLLPAEIREEIKRAVKRATGMAVITTVILILMFVYTGMRIQLANFKKRTAVAKLELAGLQPQLKKSEAYHMANMVLANEPHWEDVFKELSNLIPDNIYITKLSLKNNIIKMYGIVDSESGEELLSNFILTLENGIFKTVTLVGIKDIDEANGNKFELKCRVD